MQLDVVLDAQEYGILGTQPIYVMVNFHPSPVVTSQQRRPLNISLVIDKSGSMAGQKIDYTRQAALLVLQNLGVVDTLSVVAFNEDVETIFTPSQVKDKTHLAEKIRSIHAGGTTNLSGGWLEGIKHVEQNRDKECITRVILLSDGHANRGITDTATLLSIARQKFGEGIVTTTMGLGDDFNEDLLTALADAAGGAFYFIESPEVTPAILKEELTGLLNLSIQNLTITIEPTPLVKQVQQLNKYPVQPSQNSHLIYRIGDIYAEEERSLTLELNLHHQPEASTHTLLHLVIEFDELVENQVIHHKVSQTVSAKFTNQPQHTTINEELWHNVMILRSAQARRKAVELSDIGQFEEASRLLNLLANQIDSSPMNDSKLEEEKRALRMQAENLGRGMYERYDRKTMSTQAYFSERGRYEDARSLRSREMQRSQGISPTSKVDDTDQLQAIFSKLLSVPPQEPNQPEQTNLLGVTHLLWQDQTFELKGDLMRIGRAPQNEVVVDVSGISRFHCQLKRIGTDWLLEDLGSTNGTHVNGKIVDAPYRLQHGDNIFICNQRLRFEFRG